MICSTCKKDLPETSFTLNRGRSRGRMYKCKECTKSLNANKWIQQRGDEKTCGRCKRALPLASFYSYCRMDQTDQDPKYITSTCKECHKISVTEFKRSEKTRIVQEFGGACSVCSGRFHPASYDFHHRDPATKISQITTLFRRGSDGEALREELKKCDLVCANCHRAIHASEWEARNGEMPE